jgi:tetratricopeptide (TPR) repeat protein
LISKIEGKEGVATSNVYTSFYLLRQGKANEALDLLIDALEIAKSSPKSSPGGLNEIYLLIAEINVELDDLKWASDALERVEHAGNPHFLGRSQAIRAQIFELGEDLTKAEEMYQMALDTYEQLGSPAGLLRTKKNYARCLSAQGRTEAAEALEIETRDEAARLGLRL